MKRHSGPLVLDPVCDRLDVQPIVLNQARQVVGSGPNCSVRLQIPGIHSQHCVILSGPNRLVLKAWDIRTWLNDAPVKEATLREGDRLVVGPVVFRVRKATSDELASLQSNPPVKPAHHPATRSPAPEFAALQAEMAPPKPGLQIRLAESDIRIDFNSAATRSPDGPANESRLNEDRIAEIERRAASISDLKAEMADQAESLLSRDQFQRRSAEDLARRENDLAITTVQFSDREGQVDAILHDFEIRKQAWDASQGADQLRRRDMVQWLQNRRRRLGGFQAELKSRHASLQQKQSAWLTECAEESARRLAENEQIRQELEAQRGSLKQQLTELNERAAAVEVQQRELAAEREQLSVTDATDTQMADLDRNQAHIAEIAGEILASQTEVLKRERQLRTDRDRFEQAAIELESKQNALSLGEAALNGSEAKAAAREEFFRAQTAELDVRSSMLAGLQQTLEARGRELNAREQSLIGSEQAAIDRGQALSAREQALATREQALVAGWERLEAATEDNRQSVAHELTACQHEQNRLHEEDASLATARVELDELRSRFAAEREGYERAQETLAADRAQLAADAQRLEEARRNAEEQRHQCLLAEQQLQMAREEFETERQKFRETSERPVPVALQVAMPVTLPAWLPAALPVTLSAEPEPRGLHDSIGSFAPERDRLHADQEQLNVAQAACVQTESQLAAELARVQAEEHRLHEAAESLRAEQEELILERRAFYYESGRQEEERALVQRQHAELDERRAELAEEAARLSAEQERIAAESTQLHADQTACAERESLLAAELARVRDEEYRQQRAAEQLGTEQEELILERRVFCDEYGRLQDELRQVERWQAELDERHSALADEAARLAAESAELRANQAACFEKESQFEAERTRLQDLEAVCSQQRASAQNEQERLEVLRAELSAGQEEFRRERDVLTAERERLCADRQQLGESESRLDQQSRRLAEERAQVLAEMPVAYSQSETAPAIADDAGEQGFPIDPAGKPEETPDDTRELRSALAAMFDLPESALAARPSSPVFDTQVDSPEASAEAESAAEPDANSESTMEPPCISNASETEESIPASVTPAAEPVPETDPGAYQLEDTDPDSISAYMERLLARSRREEGDNNSGHAATKPQKPRSSSPATSPVDVMPPVSAAPPAAPSAVTPVAESVTAEIPPAEAFPLRPRRNTEEMRAGISSLRQVANHSARTAVAKHVRNRERNTMRVQLILAVLSFASAAIVLCGVVGPRWAGWAAAGLGLVAGTTFARSWLRVRSAHRPKCDSAGPGAGAVKTPEAVPPAVTAAVTAAVDE